MERETPAIVHWLFSENGIERKIYQTVLNKKDFTLYYFMKDFGSGIANTNKNNTVLETRGGLHRQNNRHQSQWRA
jgi:hypothetical protein